MDTPPAKKRRPNWTEEETLFLARKVEENKRVLRGKFGTGVTAAKEKQTWAEVVVSFEHPLLMASYLSLFSRVLLQEQDLMWSVVEQTASHLNQESQQVLGEFLNILSEKIEWMSQPERKKICAMALASLLTVNLSTVVEKFPSIINACVEVLHDVCREDETGVQVDCLVMGDEEEMGGETNSQSEEMETEHDRRNKILSRQDPVHSVSLKEYLVAQLTQCQQSHGRVSFDRLMETVDPEIQAQLRIFCG